VECLTNEQCDDGKSCTQDVCVTATGECVHNEIADCDDPALSNPGVFVIANGLIAYEPGQPVPVTPEASKAKEAKEALPQTEKARNDRLPSFAKPAVSQETPALSSDFAQQREIPKAFIWLTGKGSKRPRDEMRPFQPDTVKTAEGAKPLAKIHDTSEPSPARSLSGPDPAEKPRRWVDRMRVWFRSVVSRVQAYLSERERPPRIKAQY